MPEVNANVIKMAVPIVRRLFRKLASTGGSGTSSSGKQLAAGGSYGFSTGLTIQAGVCQDKDAGNGIGVPNPANQQAFEVERPWLCRILSTQFNAHNRTRKTLFPSERSPRSSILRNRCALESGSSFKAVRLSGQTSHVVTLPGSLTVPMENETMSTTTPTTEEKSIADRVRESFSVVAYGCTTTLQRLLKQTRIDGLDDDDVREFLLSEEHQFAINGVDSGHFRCWRTEDDEIFIESGSSYSCGIASFREAFGELESNSSSAVESRLRGEVSTVDTSPSTPSKNVGEDTALISALREATTQIEQMIDRLRNLSDKPAETPDPATLKPAAAHTDIVLEAFEHVAFGFSVTLPRLLKECRERGLTDDQTRAALIELENVYEDEARQLFAARSPADELFIHRMDSASSMVASMREMFFTAEQQ